MNNNLKIVSYVLLSFINLAFSLYYGITIMNNIVSSYLMLQAVLIFIEILNFSVVTMIDNNLKRKFSLPAIFYLTFFVVAEAVLLLILFNNATDTEYFNLVLVDTAIVILRLYFFDNLTDFTYASNIISKKVVNWYYLAILVASLIVTTMLLAKYTVYFKGILLDSAIMVIIIFAYILEFISRATSKNILNSSESKLWLRKNMLSSQLYFAMGIFVLNVIEWFIALVTVLFILNINTTKASILIMLLVARIIAFVVGLIFIKDNTQESVNG